MKVKYQDNKPVPEGFYLGQLDGLEPTVHAQYGDNIKWSFTIIESREHPEVVGSTITGMTSTKVSPKSKMFAWLQAFGVIMGESEEFEMDTLLGQRVKLKVENTTKKSVVDGRDHEITYSNVKALAAYNASLQQPAAAPPTAAPVPAAATAIVQTPPAAAPPAVTAAATTVPPQDLDAGEEFDF